MFDIPMKTSAPMSLSNLANTLGGGATRQPTQQAGPQQMFNGQMQGQGFTGQAPMQQGFAAPNTGVQNQGYAQPQQMQGLQQQQPVQQQGFQQPQYAQQPMQPKQRPSGNGVILKKGQKTSLSKLNPNLDLIEVGLGWDLAPGGQSYDLDVEAFLLNKSDRVIGDDWFVFYNQPISPDGSVRLLSDSTTGAGVGDDEIIQVKLSQVNAGVSKILFIVTINEALEHGYNFSNVQNAYVRIVDKQTNNELVRFNLTDYYNTVCSMMVGEVYKHNNEWKFSPIGDGVSQDLGGLCARYGVSVGG